MSRPPEDRIKERLEERHGVVEFWLSRRGRYLVLDKFIVPKSHRGRGVGSAFMRDLVDAADREGLAVAVTPSTAFGASSLSRLEGFYREFDFTRNEGSDRDFKTKHAMYRAPGGGGW